MFPCSEHNAASSLTREARCTRTDVRALAQAKTATLELEAGESKRVPQS